LSPVENINLPAALLSRFDVMFLLLDTPTREGDEELASHVTYVHMHKKHPESEDAGVMFTPHEVRQYIAKARTFRPVVPTSVSDYMVGAYVAMRKRQKQDEARRQQFSHVTPRTLLGIVRLSQALARLRFSEEVVREDVDEALRLIEVSKASLYNDGDASADHTPSSKIYTMIRNLRESGAAAVGDGDDNELSVRRIRERVLAKGFTEDQLTTALYEYTELGVSVNFVRHLFEHSTNFLHRSGKLLAMARASCLLKVMMRCKANEDACFSFLGFRADWALRVRKCIQWMSLGNGCLGVFAGQEAGSCDLFGQSKDLIPNLL
jgi:DNA replicative helicase MCM subunit Mcm2 (Cdc46/Mcm family)